MWDDCKDFDCKNSKCVCKTVRNIAAAQDEVVTPDCDVSCKQSIQNLVSPTVTTGNDTIPFILYCKGDCKPFVGSGVLQDVVNNTTNFFCFESPIFRVSKIHKDCCADLELLLPVNSSGQCHKKKKSLCDLFDGVTGLQRTGICIKVDLCDFVAISCLEPVRALPVSDLNVANAAKEY
ncbi:CotY/CotZ family spore coat protein [Alkalibacillus haloalkaliphilus]|uniref:CotY/CotZ family spore coat protein n=1 Tax=Alkalibacillus haloalkaliphilus TaxID=94136 RepID=UPI0002F9945D|nr:CotY/CotZ family spore coat protein [Alkalibacillus haloalkaliphilus]